MFGKKKILADANVRRYFSNTVWILFEKGLRVLDGFFIGIWIARYLGPSDFGILSYAESFVYLFAAIAALGLDQIVTKELVNNSSSRDEILGTTLGLRLLGFVVMFSLIVGATQFLDHTTLTNTMIFVIASSILLQSFKGIDFYFQSNVRSKYTVIGNIVAVGAVAAVKVFLIFSKAPLIYFGYVIVAEWIIISLSYIIAYHLSGLSIWLWKFKAYWAKRLLSKSWFLIIGSVAAALYMKIDQVMIKEILGEESLGIYSVAVKLTGIWLFVTAAITQSVFPSLVNIRKSNRDLFLKRLQQLYDLLIKIAIVVSLIYTLSAHFFVPLLFGNEYSDSSDVLVLYIWSIVFVFLSNGSWGYYLNENLEKFSSIRLVVGAIINITLNIFFIKWYGLVGAAYATLISYAISGYLINALFKKTRENFKLQTKAFVNIFNINTWTRLL
jgi:O-antigen/teichoic acid export membrane protein